MKSKLWRCFLSKSILLLFPYCLFAAPTPIVFWHSMSGQLGVAVKQLAFAFNKSQTEFAVMPVYKGDYTESLTSFAAAFRAKQAPNMIQVFEVGSSVMRFPEGITIPVESLFREQGIRIAKEKFFPAVLNTYSESNQLMAFPFNVSVPVLFYNADALARFGIQPNAFPRTWEGFAALVKRIHNAGYQCVYSTAYPSWILLESYSALHGLEGEAKNKDLIHHLNRLKRWQMKHYFEYGGHIDDATVLFTSARCPLFSQSSGAYASLSEMVPFKLGVAPLPLDTRVSPKRHNNSVGGAAIWVVSGQSAKDLRGIALFLAFLARPEIQQQWYAHTGYLPLQKNDKQLIEGETPHTILDIANFDLSNPDENTPTMKDVAQNQVRKINDQMLESIFSGILGTESAMSEATLRSAHVCKRFVLNTQ